ncbi:phage integrase family protein [Glaciihabitans tibetensis]|uniref:Phage integrase family protein n=1 Tax=Glaciihabitans tibetensis TaxID=1266600 RepID=A0A2T0VAU8_9MICO|nr:phage integrase family protein [Glaciihabitans tibetensis]
MDITEDTHAQHQADSDRFYRQLEQAGPAHISAIAQEGTRSAQLDIIVRDSAQWRQTYSQKDAANRVHGAARNSAERDRARYARSKRRYYVTAITRSLLPSPRSCRRGWFDQGAVRIGRPGPTPHEMRHTAASLAISAGANVKAVQRVLGHASASVTLDVYSDLFDTDLDAVSAALDEAIVKSNVAILLPEGALISRD